MNETRPNRVIMTTNSYDGIYGSNLADVPTYNKPPLITRNFDSTRSGSSCPGFREKIRTCNDATTNFVAERHDIKGSFIVGMSQVTRDNAEQDFGAEVIWVLPPIQRKLIDDNVSSKALNDAASSFNDSTYNALVSFESGSFLGELAETVDLLRRPAKGLFRALGDYLGEAKKLARVSKRRRLKHAADLWLEHAYGWVPLIHDLDGIAKTINKDNTGLRVIPVGGRGRAENRSTYTTSWGAGLTYLTIPVTEHHIASVRYVGAVKSTYVTPVGRVMEAWGLTPEAFTPTAWNLIPYSFVVDYFTNVDEIIKGISLRNLKFAWASCTSRCEVRQTMGKPIPTPVYESKDRTVTGSDAQIVSKYVNRFKVPSPPVPDITFSVPGAKQIANLAALAISHRDARKSLFS